MGGNGCVKMKYLCQSVFHFSAPKSLESGTVLNKLRGQDKSDAILGSFLYWNAISKWRHLICSFFSFFFIKKKKNDKLSIAVVPPVNILTWISFVLPPVCYHWKEVKCDKPLIALKMIENLSSEFNFLLITVFCAFNFVVNWSIAWMIDKRIL